MLRIISVCKDIFKVEFYETEAIQINTNYFVLKYCYIYRVYFITSNYNRK